jgi:hypothetical protein
MVVCRPNELFGKLDLVSLYLRFIGMCIWAPCSFGEIIVSDDCCGLVTLTIELVNAKVSLFRIKLNCGAFCISYLKPDNGTDT